MEEHNSWNKSRSKNNKFNNVSQNHITNNNFYNNPYMMLYGNMNNGNNINYNYGIRRPIFKHIQCKQSLTSFSQKLKRQIPKNWKEFNNFMQNCEPKLQVKIVYELFKKTNYGVELYLI